MMNVGGEQIGSFKFKPGDKLPEQAETICLFIFNNENKFAIQLYGGKYYISWDTYLLWFYYNYNSELQYCANNTFLFTDTASTFDTLEECKPYFTHIVLHQI